MRKTKTKYSLLAYGLISLLICFLVPSAILAQETTNPSTDDSLVTELNNQISQKKKEIDELKKQSDVYEQNIKVKQREAVNLNNQIAILDNRIAKIQIDIKTAETEIEEANLEIKNTELGITGREKQIANQKEILSELVRTIYNKDSKNGMEIIFLNNSFSEFFAELNSLEEMEKDLQTNLNRVKILKLQLETQKSDLEGERQKIETFKSELENKQDALNDEENIKEKLLVDTRNSEYKFTKLLTQLKNEQQQIDAEIVDLESEVRKKLEASKIGSISSGLIWPVSKARGITAYFHDPDYPLRYVFEHPAIDIRAAQGTPIKAVASGYVARAKDAGMGYSYVMLIHDQGISTVYGHVSKILVKEDTYINQGDTIALSGGTPGTRGAGNLTTGPHLHFEVRLNGIPVNPLEYLP
jgi:murein DD-endopeptidase MepM/ murein hydrolase activator NlpD